MLSGSHKRLQALTEDALRQLIRVALDKGYYTEYLHHPERNISVDDVIHGLERNDWTLARIEWNEAHQRYSYRVSTVDIEGDGLIVLVAAHPQQKRIEILSAW